jgi:stress response protein YsnF
MTTLTKEQIRKLVEWMEDRSLDTDVDNQARTYRKQLLEDLGETHVREMATIDGIVLNNEHLAVQPNKYRELANESFCSLRPGRRRTRPPRSVF